MTQGDQASRADAMYQRACEEILAGRGPFALPILQECRRLNPSHFQSARLLAGLLMKNGMADEGRKLMEEFFLCFPYRTTGTERGEMDSALLLIRGFSKTQIIPRISSGGSLSTTLRGGIFSTQFLLLAPNYPIHHYTIAAGNILRTNDLPSHALMLNSIADADVEGETLNTLALYLTAYPDQRIINHPDKVLRLTRDQNSQRLNGIAGVRFPKTYRLQFDGANADQLATAIDQYDFGKRPVILKAAGAHTSHSVPLFRDKRDIQDFVGTGDLRGDFYLIQYIEETWKNRYFRKLRLFWINGQFYPVVCHIDTVWNVHGGNRRDVMRNNAALMAEEISFLKDWPSFVGSINANRLAQVSELVDLDFFGIDFTIDSEGNLLIYEVNPAMRHSFDHSNDFPYKLPHDIQISQAFAEMVSERMRPEL